MQGWGRGKRSAVLRGGVGCLGDRYICYQNCFARLPLDIRLIALVVMPVLGNISTESQRKRNADVIYHASVKCVVVRENSANLVCRQETLHNTSLLHSNC